MHTLENINTVSHLRNNCISIKISKLNLSFFS